MVREVLTMGAGVRDHHGARVTRGRHVAILRGAGLRNNVMRTG